MISDRPSIRQRANLAFQASGTAILVHQAKGSTFPAVMRMSALRKAVLSACFVLLENKDTVLCPLRRADSICSAVTHVPTTMACRHECGLRRSSRTKNARCESTITSNFRSAFPESNHLIYQTLPRHSVAELDYIYPTTEIPPSRRIVL